MDDELTDDDPEWQQEQAIEAAWKRAMYWKVGDSFWCDRVEFVITYIQPRKRIVWAKAPGGKDHEFRWNDYRLSRYFLTSDRPARHRSVNDEQLIYDRFRREFSETD